MKVLSFNQGLKLHLKNSFIGLQKKKHLEVLGLGIRLCAEKVLTPCNLSMISLFFISKKNDVIL